MVQKKKKTPKASPVDQDEQHEELIRLLGRLIAIRWREQRANPPVVKKPVRPILSSPRKR